MSESVLQQELRLLKQRVDKIERMLEFIVDRFLAEEDMSEEDREALREALEEYKRGKTILLEDVFKQLEE